MTDKLTTIETIAIQYGVTPEQIEVKRAAYAALSCDTPKGYEEVRLAIADCRSTRVSIEKRRVEVKADALAFGKRVDAEAKRLTAMIADIEDPLQAKKSAIDEAKARVKAEKEAAEKAALEAQIRAEKEAEEARVRAEQEAENARLAAIAEANRIEAERLAAERAKLDADRIAEENRQRVAREQEEARLAAVRAEQEAKARAASEEEDRRIAAERAAVEAERAKVEAQRRETERLEAERLARVEAEKAAARAKAEAEEAAVRMAEHKAAMKARIDALKPDEQKLRAWSEQLMRVPPPAVSSPEAKAAIEDAHRMLLAIVDRLRRFDNVCAEAAE